MITCNSPYTLLHPTTATIGTPNMLLGVYGLWGGMLRKLPTIRRSYEAGISPAKFSSRKSTTYNFMSQGLSAICSTTWSVYGSGSTNSAANQIRTGYRIWERRTVANGKITFGSVNDEFMWMSVLTYQTTGSRG